MVGDFELTDVGKELAEVVARGGSVRVSATMETFAWLSLVRKQALIGREPLVVESGNDADEAVLAAMQVAAQSMTLLPTSTLDDLANNVRDDALWKRGCVFVGTFRPLLRVDASEPALFSSFVDEQLRHARPEARALVQSREQNHIEASFESQTLGRIASELGVQHDRIPWSSITSLRLLVRSRLPSEQSAVLDKLAVFGRGGDDDWLKLALTEVEYNAMLALVELGLLTIFARRTILLSALARPAGAEASRAWSNSLRSLASRSAGADPRSVVELHRVLASSADPAEQREAAKWARFGASVLLDRASQLSKQREFTHAAELYDQVISLAHDGGEQAADKRSVAYAIHYRAFNRFHADELSERQLVTEYRRSVARWPENTTFWERLIPAAGGFVQRSSAAFDEVRPPGFEALHATHAEALRATNDTPATKWHLFDRVINKLDAFGSSGWIASMPLIRHTKLDAPYGTQLQILDGMRLDTRWLWAEPNARLGLANSVAVTVEPRARGWRIVCESLEIDAVQDSSLPRAWNMFVDQVLRSLEQRLCGEARDREQCPALDEAWTAGGGALSRWVASLSRLRSDASPAVACLRKAAHHVGALKDPPQLEVREGAVELYWRSVEGNDGELLVRAHENGTTTSRWLADGCVVDRPTFSEQIERLLQALGAASSPLEALPRELRTHSFETERGAIYRAPAPGAVELLDGSRQAPPTALNSTATAYFFDPTPEKLWSHDCWFAFAAPSGALSPRYPAAWPPRDLDRWIPVKARARK